MNEDKITIVLSESDHAKEFNKENFIYQKEFENAIQLIKDAFERPRKEKYLHNSITVLGTRGSGKTSFLLSINERIKSKNFKDLPILGNLGDKLEVLEVIDPTLVEEKGHVFLNVIAIISKRVEDKLSRNECDPTQNNSIYNRKSWDDTILNLAAGLPSIDGVGHASMDDWQDPEFVMQRGLRSVSAARELASNFDTLLKEALLILGKEAFLLGFDDIDVDSSKGWTVLECIRKYFTTSRLITILSGDLKLYTTVIRQQKWESFGEKMLKYEQHNLNNFNSMVTELTSQYLLKIMQPKNRIHLSTLLEQKSRTKNFPIDIVLTESGVKMEIEEMYQNFFKKQGISNKTQQEVYSSFLLAQPLRSQIHFLTEINKIFMDDADKNNIYITDIFLSDLLEKGVDINRASNNPKYLNISILKLLLSEHILKDHYQLQPTSTDNSLNASLFSLSMLESQFIQRNSLYLVFDYMIRIGYVRNLLSIVQQDIKDKKNQSSYTPSIEDLCEKTGLLQEGVLRDITGYMQSYLYGYYELIKKNSDFTTSYIQLSGLARPAKRNLEDRLDRVFSSENVSVEQEILGKIPGFSGSFNYKNESRVAYSIYLLIGTIGELIKLYDTLGTEGDRQNKLNINIIKNALKEMSQLRTYPIIDFSLNSSPGTSTRNVKANNNEIPNHEELIDDETGNSGKAANQTDSDNMFYIHLLDWIKSGENLVRISPHVLGKISTRFFYTMINLATVPSVKRKLGIIFHHQIIAFMNSVLIEDVRENIEDITFLNISNTKFSDTIFLNNLNNIKKQDIDKNKLNFSMWLLACPLLTNYLEDKEGLRKALSEYCEDYMSESNFSVSLHLLLNNVDLKSVENNNNKDNSEKLDK